MNQKITKVTDKQIQLAKSLLNQIHTATKQNEEIERKLDILNNILNKLIARCDDLNAANMLLSGKNAPEITPEQKELTPLQLQELRESLKLS